MDRYNYAFDLVTCCEIILVFTLAAADKRKLWVADTCSIQNEILFS
jgi:hypothetical protein